MLSIIIPSYKEPYLQRTIDDIRANAETDVEIIAVLDGYRDEVKGATSLSIPHAGMREAINAGIRLSRGTHIMKTDGHCSFTKGFDRVLLENIEDNWVVIPRRYALDPIEWKVLPDRPVDYDKLTIHSTRGKFHGEEWKSRARQRKDIMIDETMMFQGSCWVMSRKHWNTIGELDTEHYGPFVQEPVEIAFKTWRVGGKLMVNKNTSYAHKHRDFNRTHHVTKEEQDVGNDYALATWKDDYGVIKKRFGVL